MIDAIFGKPIVGIITEGLNMWQQNVRHSRQTQRHQCPCSGICRIETLSVAFVAPESLDVEIRSGDEVCALPCVFT